ncbi:hypothetical protein IFR05_014306 [Cadophora sp. M221]|nr:hypothetical protein IFR05_014306 [Cadophora sp. M221]
MDERTSRLGQKDRAEYCHELEPHSPATSHSSWNTESAETSSGMFKGPRRKGSQCRLRAWIAIDRHSLQFISEEQRRTCPMVGCELLFHSPESMHLHLKTCACLPRGLYRCIETKMQVKVGRCESDGCHELKDRFVSAVSSSFESVKRHLSGRRSKPKQTSQPCFEKELVPEEFHSLESIWDLNTPHAELVGSGHMYPAEMDPGFDGTTQAELELDSRVIPSELYSTPDSYHPSTNRFDEENSTSPYYSDNNLEARCDQECPRDTALLQATTAIDCIQPVFQCYANTPLHLAFGPKHNNTSPSSFTGTMFNQTEPVELCARETPGGQYRPHPTNSAWELSSPAWANDSGVFHINDSATHSAKGTIPAWQSANSHHLCQSMAPTLNLCDNSEKMVVDGHESPDITCLPRPAYSSLHGTSRTDSSSSSEPSADRSMFSSFSSISTGRSSLASYNPTPTNFDNAFFPGEDSVMFDEPESMEPLIIYKPQEQTYHSHVNLDIQRCDTAGLPNTPKAEYYEKASYTEPTGRTSTFDINTKCHERQATIESFGFLLSVYALALILSQTFIPTTSIPKQSQL